LWSAAEGDVEHEPFLLGEELFDAGAHCTLPDPCAV
jgi:hypothetical protein